MKVWEQSSRWMSIERIARFSDRNFGGVVLSPVIGLITIAALIPFVILVALSMTDFSFNLPDHNGSFIAFKNFRYAIFSDHRLRSSLETQLLFLGLTEPFEFLLGFWLALKLKDSGQSARFLLPLVAIPLLLAPVTVGMIWRLILHGDYGPVGYYLTRLPGMHGLSILGDPRTAMYAVAVADIWQWTPFFAIVVYAGLRSLPEGPFRAAVVDGADSKAVFWTLTVPMLSPAISVALLVRFMDSFKEFDKVFVLTRGGPASSTELLSVYTWIVSYDHGELGYGSAITVLIYGLIYFACAAAFRMMRREWRPR